MNPIYDIEKSWAENLEKGPLFEEEYPERHFPAESTWIDFLGIKVASPLGVPAGPLLNSRWIDHAARMGFDILTYKTIRSFAYDGHPLPNMLYVEPQDSHTALWTPLKKSLTLTNSFGMPSKGPVYLIEDLQRAQNCLKKGQALVVSIVGSETQENSLFDDFVKVAHLALEGGARLIEANFSCPNVKGKEGMLYLDPEIVYTLAKKLVSEIYPVPLILKVGIFPSKELCKEVLLAATKAGVSALSGINTLSMKIIDEKGNPALGKERETGGVCGAFLKASALNFVSSARKIIDTEKLPLTLIGMGGIILPEDFKTFLEKGAFIAMTAVGMMWDPFLADKYHRRNHANHH